MESFDLTEALLFEVGVGQDSFATEDLKDTPPEHILDTTTFGESARVHSSWCV